MMNLGPVMLDVEADELTPQDKDLLLHPQCGGVIFFARNFADHEQIRSLADSIRALRRSELLIAVDQEGGRVQRFRDGFLDLPPLGDMGALYNEEPQKALQQAERYAWLMASECLAAGIDFSFAPVLDLDYGVSEVIGNRAFHSDPDAVVALATAYLQGLHRAGMAAVGKHFPGHGFVQADSHKDLPVDERDFAQIETQDLIPFKAMIEQGMEALMPAHVIYSECDSAAAGFSPFWLQEILRKRLGFEGVIFSDDLSMTAAHSAGSPADRAQAALSAGCDMLLVCNDANAAGQVLESLEKWNNPESRQRIERMRRRESLDWKSLHASSGWMDAVSSMV
jgi:beta-N-acetylhexosaminidase